MSFLNHAKKCDLARIAFELNVDVDESARQIDVLTAILKSENYEEDLAKGILNEIKEERQKEERKIELERQRAKEEDERQKEERKIELERMKYEEERQKEDRKIELERMKHELEMKRLESAAGNEKNSSGNSETPTAMGWRILLRNFELGNDFTLYLVHFERVMRSVGLAESQWTQCLLSALPTEIVEIIMREPEEKAQNYSYVKELLLKRYKLSPEKFRQLFYSHDFNGVQTWREYYHQLESFFNGWISGLNVKTFDELKDLIISDRIKKSAPAAVREYLMGEWMVLNSPLDLVAKMDEFDELNSLFRQPQISNISKPVVVKEFDRNSNSKLQCYNCYEEGHFSRDCLQPRRPKFCTACNTEGHGKKDCTEVTQNSVNLSVTKRVIDYACTKIVMINGIHSEAIVDTGADISMMKISFMEVVGCNALNVQRCSSFPIRGIGGVVQSFGTCLVDVVIDKVFLKNVQFFIVADNTFAGPNILIGKNLIDFPGVVLIRQEGGSTILHVNEFKEFCNLEVVPAKEDVAFRTPSESIIVEPLSVQLVSVISNTERKNGIVSIDGDKFSNEIISASSEAKNVNITMKQGKESLRTKHQATRRSQKVESKLDEYKCELQPCDLSKYKDELNCELADARIPHRAWRKRRNSNSLYQENHPNPQIENRYRQYQRQNRYSNEGKPCNIPHGACTISQRQGRGFYSRLQQSQFRGRQLPPRFRTKSSGSLEGGDVLQTITRMQHSTSTGTEFSRAREHSGSFNPRPKMETNSLSQVQGNQDSGKVDGCCEKVLETKTMENGKVKSNMSLMVLSPVKSSNNKILPRSRRDTSEKTDSQSKDSVLSSRKYYGLTTDWVIENTGSDMISEDNRLVANSTSSNLANCHPISTRLKIYENKAKAEVEKLM